jgi:hypothetical protein
MPAGAFQGAFLTQRQIKTFYFSMIHAGIESSSGHHSPLLHTMAENQPQAASVLAPGGQAVILDRIVIWIVVPAAVMLAGCATATVGRINAVGATGWTWQRVVVAGRILQVADTADEGSIAVCNQLREVIAAQADHPVHQCSAVTLALESHGHSTTVYDLFVLTEPSNDPHERSIQLWDSFADIPSENSGASNCGRYDVFVYRRGALEIRVLGEPIEEKCRSQRPE